MFLSRNLEIFASHPSLLTALDSLPLSEEPKLSFPLHLFDTTSSLFGPIPSPFEVCDSVLGVAHIEERPISSLYRRIRSTSAVDFSLMERSLCHPVTTALELAFDRVKDDDRKYTWTAEIKCPERKWLDQKYKLTAEIKGSETHGDDKKYNWTSEIESPEKFGVGGKYKWTAEISGRKHDQCTGVINGKHKGVAIKIKKEPACAAGVSIGAPEKVRKKLTRLVEVGEQQDQGAIFLRQAFAKRVGAAAKAKGKAKVLSPQDAAQMIQMSFRAYVVRRSNALRSMRQLAVSKAKLKEIRVLFNNFSYRQRIARDAEERKCFTERIIALLLNVDAVQGADLMVRAARRSMLDELEAMLDVVDPKPAGNLGCIKRRMFDLPECSNQSEIADVAEVVQLLDEAEKTDIATFEVCL